jgi:hypothetical protein
VKIQHAEVSYYISICKRPFSGGPDSSGPRPPCFLRWLSFRFHAVQCGHNAVKQKYSWPVASNSLGMSREVTATGETWAVGWKNCRLLSVMPLPFRRYTMGCMNNRMRILGDCNHCSCWVSSYHSGRLRALPSWVRPTSTYRMDFAPMVCSFIGYCTQLQILVFISIGFCPARCASCTSQAVTAVNRVSCPSSQQLWYNPAIYM